MTEMFNVRDEFLRTRPITAVILIDNYDELMSNLPDSTISKLDAQINEAVSGWVTGLHALCRKMERNRYLLLFESKATLPASGGQVLDPGRDPRRRESRGRKRDDLPWHRQGRKLV